MLSILGFNVENPNDSIETRILSELYFYFMVILGCLWNFILKRFSFVLGFGMMNFSTTYAIVSLGNSSVYQKKFVPDSIIMKLRQKLNKYPKVKQ